MRISLDKTLAHADGRLTVTNPAAGREELVETFRRFLKIETERLKVRHRFGLSGGEVASARSLLVDLVVCRAGQRAAMSSASSGVAESGYAVVALGGYGRQELAPFSDVDLMFLRANGRAEGMKGFVEQILYLLWDIGLTVGHSVRSVSESVRMAREDVHSRNALGEARFVTGDAHLFRQLMSELGQAVFQNKRETAAFLDAMRREVEERYAKFGRAVCVQEPNVKESPGGLRDMHTVLWIGRARFGSPGLDDLRATDHISHGGYVSARRSYDFLARVRNEAHFMTGRKADLLTFDLQPALAANLGYEPKRGLLASESLMREYYQRAFDLHQFCASFLDQVFERRSERRRFTLPSSKAPGGFQVGGGKLFLTGEQGSLRAGPLWLMKAFALAQAEGLDLSDELKQVVRSCLPLVDNAFRSSPEACQLFMEMLRQRGRVARGLRLMHETGFLGRFLPEFARITFLVQHDSYHRYTIDEHMLQAVESLDQVAEGMDPKLTRFGAVLAELPDAAPLYLGLLLHDIGKGRGGGHVARGVRIAERVCQRMGWDEHRASLVIFLVEQHLLMSHLSQRRDLAEESLIDEFIATVGTLERLNVLLLLTYADTSAVGPGVWNEWKSGLLWELYTRARARMMESTTAAWGPNQATELKRQAVQRLLDGTPSNEIDSHFSMLPEKYLRATEPEQMAEHFRLVERLNGGPMVADWRVIEEKQYTEMTVCTRDQAGLFSRIAGTLTAHGVNILSADLYTRDDGTVIDTFRVSQIGSHHPVRAKWWPVVEQDLRAAIEGTYDVEAAVGQWQAKARRRHAHRRPLLQTAPSVRFDSDASPTCTVIEVKADDEPGLAYRIAHTLAVLGLNITVAKIATDKSHALDVFYVTDSTGEKLNSTLMSNVEQALQEALESRAHPEV
jgi:[protein-PII] uridylyltransferase